MLVIKSIWLIVQLIIMHHSPPAMNRMDLNSAMGNARIRRARHDNLHNRETQLEDGDRHVPFLRPLARGISSSEDDILILLNAGAKLTLTLLSCDADGAVNGGGDGGTREK